METLNIFDAKFRCLIRGNVTKVVLDDNGSKADTVRGNDNVLKLVLEDNESKADTVQGDNNVAKVVLEGNESKADTVQDNDLSTNSGSLSCSYCKVEFENNIQQREHWREPWHRYNLKQSLYNKLPITEEDFNNITDEDGFSSISELDEENDDILDKCATAQGRIILQNENGQVFSIYKCLIFDRKEEIQEEEIAQRLTYCCNNNRWTIFMLGGGHFAGAVFDGNKAFLHKTFHCYTVRAGQGGSQSSRDNKSSGSQPKSAGASLRRYNEQALIQHVKNIVESWKTEIDKSSLIIYRASGPYNRAVLFGGTVPLLNRSDGRLRTIPFSTKRASYTEIVRVHSILSSGQVYDSLEVATKYFSIQTSPERSSKKGSVRSTCINRAKSRELVERPIPGQVLDGDDNDGCSDVEAGENIEIYDLCLDDLTISTKDVLSEYQDSLTEKQRKHYAPQKSSKKSKTKNAKGKEDARKKRIYNALIRGDISTLEEILETEISNKCENSEKELKEKKGEIKVLMNVAKEDLINEVIDDNGNTMLHISALNEHKELLLYLLDNNANPCFKNKKQFTPYTCTQSKEIRETLKEFARDNPNKYDYNKAQIPLSTLTPEEIAQKKRLKRALKKERDLAKKKENYLQKKEEEEKERFLNLTDREKRALAAEKRITSQTGAILCRCFFCACDITGKVPFEYTNNKFCSIDCLKMHRAQNPITF